MNWLGTRGLHQMPGPRGARQTTLAIRLLASCEDAAMPVVPQDSPDAPAASVAMAVAVGDARRAAWWRRLPWLLAGGLSLLLGVIGIFLPLLPTTPFVLLAAYCFARGSARCEAWLLGHPRFGPMVRDWRAHRAVPLRAKQAAWIMMTLSSVLAFFIMPHVRWLPAACCLAVGLWMWRLPTAAPQDAGTGPDAGLKPAEPPEPPPA